MSSNRPYISSDSNQSTTFRVFYLVLEEITKTCNNRSLVHQYDGGHRKYGGNQVRSSFCINIHFSIRCLRSNVLHCKMSLYVCTSILPKCDFSKSMTRTGLHDHDRRRIRDRCRCDRCGVAATTLRQPLRRCGGMSRADSPLRPPAAELVGNETVAPLPLRCV